MMEKNAEKVSLLVDDELYECDMSCVVRSMKSDEAARTRWENYHLIRDTLRGNLPRHIPAGLAKRVSLALEHEPVFVNPRIHSSTPAPFRTPSRTKATLGFALAASLSAIAVFGVGVMKLDPSSGMPAGMSVASVQPPLQVAVENVRQSPAPAVQVAAAAAVVKQPMATTVLAAAEGSNAKQHPQRHSSVAVDNDSPATTDLYDYLVNSHRYAPGAADTQEMLSYVQLVGYGPGN